MGQTYTLLALLLMLLAMAECGTRCPDRVSILPCSCAHRWPYTEVTCYSAKDNQKVLKQAFQYMAQHHMVIDKFVFLGSLAEVPESLLSAVTVHYLIFRVNDLSHVADDAFQGLDSIHSIWFYDTNLTSVPIRALSRAKLTDLIIRGNSIATIGRQLFGQMVYGSVLRNLHLTSNKIQVIGDNAFYNLVSLEELSLRDNLLQTLPASMTPTACPYLKSLILQKNALQTVPSDLIKLLPNTAAIDLSVNNITSGNFYTILALDRSINLFVNDLICNCSMMPVAIYNQDNPGKLKIQGKCKEPEALVGKYLRDLRTVHFSDCS